jgi:hypothetical protein
MPFPEQRMSTATDARDASLRTSVHVARYAEILAHLVHFGSERTGDVVERFGYSLEAWRDVDRAWTNGIASGTNFEQPAQILAFSATFHQHRARLAEQKPALESITDKQARSKTPQNQPTPGATTKSAGVPSFMLAEAARNAAPAPHAEASPWAAYAMPNLEPPVTSSMPAMPLHAKSPSESLPFVQGVAADVALQSAVEHAQKVQGATSPLPAANLGATQAIDENEISTIARRVIPFGGSSVQTDARPTRDPELTLDQHVALSVELELHPEQKAHILQRHGLTPSQHARIEAGWDAQLALNPKLAVAWQQAASKYRTRLLGST